MSRISKHHEELDETGQGKCSVPMFGYGGPCGFCDAPAYGKRPDTKWSYSYAAGRMMPDDNGYEGYVPALACPNHGGPRSRVFMDGNAYCAVLPDFINIQESPCGFGATPEEARKQLGSQS